MYPRDYSNDGLRQRGNGFRRLVGTPLVIASLAACSVEQVFVHSGPLSALRDGVVDGLGLAWASLSALVTHPMVSLDGMALALDLPHETLDLYGKELLGYLALPGVDVDAFLYASALIAVCAFVVVFSAALFDWMLARVPRIARTTRTRRFTKDTLLYRAQLLNRARNVLLEKRRGATGRGWGRAARRVGWLFADALAGAVLATHRPLAFAIYLVYRGGRWIGRRIDPFLRASLRYLVYVLLPLALLSSPWTLHTVSSSRHTAPAGSTLRQAVTLLEASIAQGNDAGFERQLADVRAAFFRYRTALQAPSVELDGRLQLALYTLAATHARAPLSDQMLDTRMLMLYDRFKRWRLFVATDIALGHRRFGHAVSPTSRSRLVIHAREAALLDHLADTADDRRRMLLHRARDDAGYAFQYERCLARWSPSLLLLNPLPSEHACCSSISAPLDWPLPACDPETDDIEPEQRP